MVEKEIFVAGCDDVVMEDAAIDNGGVLLGEESIVFGEKVLAGDSLRCSECLARCVVLSFVAGVISAIDEEVETLAGVICAEAGMVSGAFICDIKRCW